MVVYYFIIKYRRKEFSEHLINALQDIYWVTQEWTRGTYSEISPKLYYNARLLDISMLVYVKEALKKLQQENPSRI